MKRLLFIIIINLLFLNINSQEELRGDYPESIKNLYSRASFEIEVNRDYKKAEWYLNKLLKKRKEVPQAMQLLVRIYIFENDNTKALDYLKKLYKVAPNDFYNLYTYAKVLKNTGKYIQAKKLLGKMLVLAKDTLKGYEFEERYKPLVKNDLASINLSLDQIANPKNIIKTRLEGVNTKKNEYFPTLTVDQQTIMVTTKVASNKKLIDYRDNPQHEDIYVSKRVEGKWSELKSLSRKINTPLNEGAQTLSSDGRTLYFTSSGRKENLGSTDIYMSKKMPDGSWSLPQNLGVSVNSRYWDTQPSISSDGQTLFFISDRRGGVGKSDIWYCTKDKEGFWNPAKPLGRNINTRGVEYTPFVSFDGKTLYFASDGHPGMGGLDLFVSKKGDDGKWQKPVNMGYPINSFGQQVGLFVAADGETAYYADDSETNNSDIYTFKLPEDYQSEVTSFVKGRVFDEVYKTNLYSKIQLLDSKTKKIIVTTESDQKTGEYLITLPTGKMYTLYIE
jgi:Tol biopolymer transport system component